MKILLSIRPEFATQIFKGKKKYEYRKSIFKKEGIDKVIVYSTMPVGKIIGEFRIEEILKMRPEQLWQKTSEYSGISKSFFDDYFCGKKWGYAFKIKDPILYDEPIDPFEQEGKFTAPQSFKYLTDNKINKEYYRGKL